MTARLTAQTTQLPVTLVGGHPLRRAAPHRHVQRDRPPGQGARHHQSAEIDHSRLTGSQRDRTNLIDRVVAPKRFDYEGTSPKFQHFPAAESVSHGAAAGYGESGWTRRLGSKLERVRFGVAARARAGTGSVKDMISDLGRGVRAAPAATPRWASVRPRMVVNDGETMLDCSVGGVSIERGPWYAWGVCNAGACTTNKCRSAPPMTSSTTSPIATAIIPPTLCMKPTVALSEHAGDIIPNGVERRAHACTVQTDASVSPSYLR
ncbi:hypothetical protein GGX14DRAFT_666793 [Mycena pura]|uniref:Uncharacterized protein n=1 Tax=Mycena pura TaxID=153505 RepID=A0AAD6Y5Y1_9AGAR|nr:hypothetical protein GGX14DRAFT_666793 [Mycena pura]